mmetsp:Transcript_10367/g.21030  ORF Transcript_10367/g.21030 Transcript_10367/m.21030 type:complete len:150 (+) Transcript_10367:258-707(+)
MEPVMDYVRGWPDECVGDYTRCYSVSQISEASIFLPHFCRNQWEIPAAVTHISINCVEDKREALAKQVQNNQMGNLHLAQMHKVHREQIAVALFILVPTCCCGWAVLCLGYRYVVLPHLKAMKKSKSDPELQSLVASNTNEGDNQQCVV